MNHLELFSGTHSFGKVSHKLGYNVVSLDRDLSGKCPYTSYVSETHIKEDIMTWDYKTYPPNHFKLITASPVCLWWSALRRTWIGRKCKSIHPTETITQEVLQEDIDNFGKPMVDKIREIIDYFNPEYYIIENPQTGLMKSYITDLPFYDVDYCKYSNWGYQKRTRFWTNIKAFEPKKCKKDCENIRITDTNQRTHLDNMSCSKVVMLENGKTLNCNSAKLREKYRDNANIVRKDEKKGSLTKLNRYRIPETLIEELFNYIK